MRPSLALFLFAATVLAAADPAAAVQPKATVIKLNKLSAPAPAGWVNEKPSNLLRKYQFKLPGEKDGPAAEVMVMPDTNPKVDAVFPKWKGEFATEEVSKVSKLEVPGATVHLLDVTGTWKYRVRPLDPKSEERPDYRVVWAVVVESEEATQVRLSGPKEVVAKNYPAFEAWLKALK